VTPILFAKALLERLHLPVTDNNIAALVGLQAQEGGHVGNAAAFNPTNVTQPMPGSYTALVTPAHIQGYQSWDQGVEATAKLLSNGLYSGVLASLGRSAPPADTLKEIALSPFGWYKIVGGQRVPLPYPGALAAAANWKSVGAIVFPDVKSGIAGLIRFGGSPLARAAMTVAAVGAIGLVTTGVVLVVYGLVKKRKDDRVLPRA
jgi:hypothetical protein